MAPKIQWPLVLFSMLAGCGGCAFAFAGIAECDRRDERSRSRFSLLSWHLVGAGGCRCYLLDDASGDTPSHAFAAVTHLLSFSGISVELIMLGVVSALLWRLFAGSIVFIGNATATLVLGHCWVQLSGVVPWRS